MILHPGEVKRKSDLTFEKEGIRNISYKFQVQIEYYSLGDKKEKDKYCIKYSFEKDANIEQIYIKNSEMCD